MPNVEALQNKGRIECGFRLGMVNSFYEFRGQVKLASAKPGPVPINFVIPAKAGI